MPQQQHEADNDRALLLATLGDLRDGINELNRIMSHFGEKQASLETRFNSFEEREAKRGAEAERKITFWYSMALVVAGAIIGRILTHLPAIPILHH